MTDLVPHRRVHIVGTAGAGMSALAKVLAQAGHVVSGSDIKPGPALLALQGVGVTTWVGHRPDAASEWDLVVASSAVPEGDPEVAAARSAGVEVWQRPRLLEELSSRLPTIGVTGTHGKTTTTAMVLTALRALGRDPSFIVGGELVDLNTNAHLGTEPMLVLEADEAFGTFLDLHLRALAITNVEEDHLDHYGTMGALVAAFQRVAAKVDGPVVGCIDDAGVRQLIAEDPGIVSYGTSAEAEWRVSAMEHGRRSVSFHLSGRGHALRVKVPKPGEHVARNAAAALALMGEMGFDVAAAAEGLARFGGVRRRFEVRIERGGITVVDDYAVHPTETAAIIEAAARGHEGRVIAVFQPHRFTRTAEHGAALGASLAAAHQVYVTDVYASSEAPIPGVTGRLVADAAATAGASVSYVPRRQDVATAILADTAPGDIILLLGAGDITLVGDELAVALAETP